MAIKTAQLVGDKPVFVPIGEYHAGGMMCNLHVYMHRFAVSNWRRDGERSDRVLVFFVEYCEGDGRVRPQGGDMLGFLEHFAMTMSCSLYNVFGIDPVPVDIPLDAQTFNRTYRRWAWSTMLITILSFFKAKVMLRKKYVS